MNRDDLPPPVPPAERPAGRAARPDGPIPELFSDRSGRRRPDRDHLLPDLVVRELGRQPGPAVRARRLPAGNLSAVRAAGLGADRRRDRADAAGLPDRQSDRADAGRSRREAARADAGGARDLSRPEAGVRDAVLGPGIELSPRRPGRISLAGHVVDRADLAVAERGDRQQLPGKEEHISVFLPCAPNPTTGFFFYVPQEQDHRDRDERRRRRDPDHVRRRGAARLRPAEEDRRPGRHGQCRAGGESAAALQPATGEGRSDGSESFTPPRSAGSLHPARTDRAGTAALRRARPSASDCPS